MITGFVLQEGRGSVELLVDLKILKLEMSPQELSFLYL